MKSRVFTVANANSAMRWLWYGLIGTCLAIGLFVYASLSSAKYDHKYDKWAQLAILTAIVFGYLLKWGWRYHKKAKFWESYLIALFVHCALFVMVFSRGSWHILLLAVVGSFEVMTLAMVIAWFMDEKH